MRTPMGRAIAIFGAFAALTLFLIVLGALRNREVSCEVCIEFRGRTACREALGPTHDEAVRTATDNACAFLASGMTDSVACQNTPPASVRCSDD